MKKTIALSLFALVLLLNACKKVNQDKQQLNTPTIKSATEIDAFIKQELRTKGSFEWNTAPDDIVWSALQLSDQILSVGYQPVGEINVEERLADIDIEAANWKTAKAQVLKIILQTVINIFKGEEKAY
jgi:hypothetical protein